MDLELEFANVIRDQIPGPEPAKGQVRNTETLDAAIKRDPADATAHLYRGMLHFEQRNDGLAIADIDEAVKLDPKTLSLSTYEARSTSI